MRQPGYRWWRDAPKLVRRFYWRMFLPPVIVPVVLITVGLRKRSLPRMEFVTLAAVVVAVAVLLGLWLYAIGHWEKRLVRRLRGADYRLCPHCGFALAGHEGRCNCPECGTSCDLDKVQAAWRSFRPRISGDSN